MAIFIGDYKYEATIFPDGCPQAWNLPPYLLGDDVKITWKYENLNEFWILIQLTRILIVETIEIWYCPFARQDKRTTNQSCFGLNPFLEIFRMYTGFTKIVFVDMHNHELITKAYGDDKFLNKIPKHQIPERKDGVESVIIFPDQGAKEKYKEMYHGHMYDAFIKKRDPSTGQIVAYEPSEHLIAAQERVSQDKNVIGMLKTIPIIFTVIDDICDGGATFIKCAENLTKMFPLSTLHLRTTYGIYSKGKQCLRDAGYQTIKCLYELPGRNPLND